MEDSTTTSVRGLEQNKDNLAIIFKERYFYETPTGDFSLKLRSLHQIETLVPLLFMPM